MTEAEMSLILTVFWTHSISDLKRASVKASLSLVEGVMISERKELCLQCVKGYSRYFHA